METVDFTKFFSKFAKGLKGSDIRKLLKLSKEVTYYFAGGLPHADTFPVKELAEIMADVVKKPGALQYGLTSGVEALREEIAKYERKQGLNISKDDVMITVGAQEGLDILAEILLDGDDKIASGRPIYLGEKQILDTLNVKPIMVPQTDEGLSLSELEKKLADGCRFKYLYTVPDFDNPTGATIPLENRNRILELASEYDFLVIEDSPYRELRYVGKSVPQIKSLDTEGRVIKLGTFSKTACPGFRLGYLIANPEILNKAVLRKQARTLCTGTFDQFVMAEYMRRGHFEKHLEDIPMVYAPKFEAMLCGIKNHFPKDTWHTSPQGGLFIWAEIPGINTRELLENVLLNAEKMGGAENRIIYVPGDAFAGPENSMRLNFSLRDIDVIEKGMEILGNTLKEYQWQRSEDYASFARVLKLV